MNSIKARKRISGHDWQGIRRLAGPGRAALRIRILAIFCGLPLLLPWASGAESRNDYGTQVVRCESRSMRMVRCAMDTGNGVDLVRQLSGNACIRNSDWGTDSRGLWVTHGCRAEFASRQRKESAGQRIIRCESVDGRQQVCRVALRGGEVRLLRQLTAAPCRLHSTWGVDRNAVWVSRGCSGEFEISDEDGVFADVERLVRCESRSQRRRVCNTTVLHKVTLSNQLSTSACVEARDWGWNGDGIWVDHGCRAEFRVD
ncbi:MAG: DUF3011 domain-containing protein [Xanthomonadaceae bacterium]|nr:DUF3011 domain-containing protein [Xanthomonadaceae bacterium]